MLASTQYFFAAFSNLDIDIDVFAVGVCVCVNAGPNLFQICNTTLDHTFLYHCMYWIINCIEGVVYHLVYVMEVKKLPLYWRQLVVGMYTGSLIV